ncbi:hypothetical protein, partial [Desulfosporosinus fructosivorans]
YAHLPIINIPQGGIEILYLQRVFIFCIIELLGASTVSVRLRHLNPRISAEIHVNGTIIFPQWKRYASQQ